MLVFSLPVETDRGDYCLSDNPHLIVDVDDGQGRRPDHVRFPVVIL